jgi:hypothetical protein
MFKVQGLNPKARKIKSETRTRPLNRRLPADGRLANYLFPRKSLSVLKQARTRILVAARERYNSSA